jgi:hypothetical protein
MHVCGNSVGKVSYLANVMSECRSIFMFWAKNILKLNLPYFEQVSPVQQSRQIHPFCLSQEPCSQLMCFSLKVKGSAGVVQIKFV